MSEQKSDKQEQATTQDTSKYVPKEEVDKLQGSLKDLEKQLDEAKLSLLDPEYISFLDSKKHGKTVKAVEKSIKETLSDEDLSDLSSSQILNLAVERAVAAVREEFVKPLSEEYGRTKQTLSDVIAVLELQDIQKKYKDFEDYRGDVKKIIESSKVPLTFEQAYLQAKGVKLAQKADEDETAAAEARPRFSSERPSRSIPQGAVQKTVFKDATDASEDAWDQVIGRGVNVL